MTGMTITATVSGITTTGAVAEWEDRTINGVTARYYRIDGAPYWFHQDNVTIITNGITITPRYADRKATIPMPTWRNVHTDNGYVGCVLVHDGVWTPLYRTDDLNNPIAVDVLKQAADQMNGSEASQ